jgi:hypothetical protein
MAESKSAALAVTGSGLTSNITLKITKNIEFCRLKSGHFYVAQVAKILVYFQCLELACVNWMQHACDMAADKTITELLRAYSSIALKRTNTAVVWASSCEAPICLPIIGRGQERDLLYTLMANDYRKTMAAIATGCSTCRNYKDAIEYTARRFNRSPRTVKTAIAATLSSE